MRAASDSPPTEGVTGRDADGLFIADDRGVATALAMPLVPSQVLVAALAGRLRRYLRGAAVRAHATVLRGARLPLRTA